jgi:hypothetical protein
MIEEGKVQVAFRLPASLVNKIDLYAEQMRKQNPGLNPNRSDVVRVLLAQALAEFPAARRKSKTSQK